MEENNKRFLAAMHPELGIFRSSSADGVPSAEASTLSLPQSTPVAERESSWTMSVD